ncbi:MAG: sulfite exporter TauE/SafE family protein [Candidatus Nanopelagicales bacterium]
MEYLLLVLAGIAAGALNAAVGAGTLITFPALVATGLNPVVANGTSSLGLLPGNLTGAYAYRDYLTGQWKRIAPWIVATAIGAVVGALLVVKLPPGVFTAVVPWLIASACFLVLVQPLVKKLRRDEDRPLVAIIANGVVGIYGGYFGAGQGVAYLAVLGAFATKTLQEANAFKNVLAGIAGLIATIIFCVSGVVSYGAALAVAVGALIGGAIGGYLAKLAPEWLFRLIVVAVGIVAMIQVIVKQ